MRAVDTKYTSGIFGFMNWLFILCRATECAFEAVFLCCFLFFKLLISSLNDVVFTYLFVMARFVIYFCCCLSFNNAMHSRWFFSQKKNKFVAPILFTIIAFSHFIPQLLIQLHSVVILVIIHRIIFE